MNDDTTSGITDIREAFPGSEYVDVLGVITLNAYPFASDATAVAARMNRTQRDAPVGIEQWRKFAELKQVPMAVEWGSPASDDGGGGGGGGDSPAYMAGMYEWFAKHGGTGPGQVEYENLFNESTNLLSARRRPDIP